MIAYRLINWERSICGVRTREQEKRVAARHEEQEAEEAEKIRKRKEEEEARLEKNIEEYQKEEEERMIDFYAAIHMREAIERGVYCKQELKIMYFRQMADQLEAQEEDEEKRIEQLRKDVEQWQHPLEELAMYQQHQQHNQDEMQQEEQQQGEEEVLRHEEATREDEHGEGEQQNAEDATAEDLPCLLINRGHENSSKRGGPRANPGGR